MSTTLKGCFIFFGFIFILAMIGVATNKGSKPKSEPSHIKITSPSPIESPKIEATTEPVIKIKSTETITEPAVKMSNTGICHAKGTQYYNRTKNYTAYSSIQECLNAGGRLPK